MAELKRLLRLRESVQSRGFAEQLQKVRRFRSENASKRQFWNSRLGVIITDEHAFFSRSSNYSHLPECLILTQKFQ